MAVMVDGREIVLTGTVGDLLFSDSFTHGDIIFALGAVGRENDVTIRMNSGGGIATEGLAIHAALKAHQGKKTIVVEGVAASAASVIAMAGDEVVMSSGAMMMVHDPALLTLGTAADHQKSIEQLNAIAVSAANVYAEKTGRPFEDCLAEMRAETWMTAAEAVAAGYADRAATDTPPEQEPEPTAFNYHLYRHPPARMVATADRHARTRRDRPAATAASPRHTEKPMATQTAGNEPASITTTADDNVVRLDQARLEGRNQALAYVKQVRDICSLAGKPEMADGFIASDTSPDAVTKALLDARAEADKATSVVGLHGVPSGSPTHKPGSGAASMKKLLKLEA